MKTKCLTMFGKTFPLQFNPTMLSKNLSNHQCCIPNCNMWQIQLLSMFYFDVNKDLHKLSFCIFLYLTV